MIDNERDGLVVTLNDLLRVYPPLRELATDGHYIDVTQAEAVEQLLDEPIDALSRYILSEAAQEATPVSEAIYRLAYGIGHLKSIIEYLEGVNNFAKAG